MRPEVGVWYTLDGSEPFEVIMIDDGAVVDVQYEDGGVEEIDYEDFEIGDLRKVGSPLCPHCVKPAQAQPTCPKICTDVVQSSGEAPQLLPQHKFERIGSLRRCPETSNGYHCVEAGDNVCVLCFASLGKSPIRIPIRVPA